jgi:enoyl-CoA hydratase/carnithine racemase
VATVTFQRPERLNALTFEVYADLRDLLTELPQRDGPRVLVLTGSGRGFCSGGDVHDIIGALQRLGPRELLDFTRMTGAVVRGLRELPLPVVAAVNGVAAGAGAVIALAADLRLLARSASLQFLFTRVGLAGADMGCAYLLPRLVGLGRAKELIFTGRPVGADEALRIGLVNRVVPAHDLATEAAELAGGLAAGPTLALGLAKQALNQAFERSTAEGMEAARRAQRRTFASADHAEAKDAFAERRPPRFGGR